MSERAFPRPRAGGWVRPLRRVLPEILICIAAIALSYGLRIVAFMH